MQNRQDLKAFLKEWKKHYDKKTKQLDVPLRQTLTCDDMPLFNQFLNEHPSITALNLWYNEFGNDVAAILIKHNTTLTTLDLRHCRLTSLCLPAFIDKSSTLASLDLSSNHFYHINNYFDLSTYNEHISFFSVMKLTSLSLYGCGINDSIMRALSANTSLTFLDLGFNSMITADGLREFVAHNRSLITMHFNDGWLESDGTIILAQHPTLKQLHLNNNNIGIAGLQALAFAKLNSLHLEHNHITNEGAKILVGSTTLKELSLRDNEIDDTAAAAFAKSSSLTTLDLSRNRLGEDGAKVLAKSSAITSLDISCNNIGNNGAMALGLSTRLQILNLLDNNITFESIETFAKNTMLIQLILSQNNISDAGAELLTKNNTTLQNLEIAFCGLTDNTANSFAHYSTARKKRLALGIFGNSITDLGVKALASNPQLKCKIFSDCYNPETQPYNAEYAKMIKETDPFMRTVYGRAAGITNSIVPTLFQLCVRTLRKTIQDHPEQKKSIKNTIKQAKIPAELKEIILKKKRY